MPLAVVTGAGPLVGKLRFFGPSKAAPKPSYWLMLKSVGMPLAVVTGATLPPGPLTMFRLNTGTGRLLLPIALGVMFGVGRVAPVTLSKYSGSRAR